jgi:hypothetical protein
MRLSQEIAAMIVLVRIYYLKNFQARGPFIEIEDDPEPTE